MKKFPTKIKKISLRITLYFSIILILIALAISIINIRIYSDELSAQIDNVVFQKLSLITGKLNKNVEDIKYIHTAMLNDNSIKTGFQNTMNNPSKNNIYMLSTYIDNHPSISSDNISVLAIGIDGDIYNPISDFPAYQGLTTNNPSFELLQKEKNYFRFSKPNTFPLEYLEPTMQQRNNITLYAQYYNYTTMTHMGYLAINFKKNRLFNDIEDLATETFSTTYIVDENNEIIHQIGSVHFESVLPYIEENDTIKIDNITYSILMSSLPSYERWQIITIFDRDIISIETNRLNQFIYLTLAIALLIMILVSWFISQKITNPIREMIHSMNEFDLGHWPMPLETTNEDEIKDLINGYNSMLTSFIKLTDNMIMRHQENKMIELNLIRTQIGLLEAQINPHFIHNTLNSMNYLALSEGNSKLSKIIESFNKLLHMSMAIDVSFVTVTQEIENIKNYARIQAVRFEDAFEVDYFIDPDASIGKIPKLILQPLVENSITHGILPMSKSGHISITIKKTDDELCVTILDDGIGIASDKVKSLVKIDSKRYVSEHIGIQNVVDRIKLYYGDNITFDIESDTNQGMKIEFKIPYED